MTPIPTMLILLGAMVPDPSRKDENKLIPVAAWSPLTRCKSVVKVFHKDSLYASDVSPWPIILLAIDRRWQQVSR